MKKISILILAITIAGYAQCLSAPINTRVGLKVGFNPGTYDPDDGSGELKVKNITGDIDIDDGSGRIEVENVIGNLYIDDGSGDIDVSYVTGDVYIDILLKVIVPF